MVRLSSPHVFKVSPFVFYPTLLQTALILRAFVCTTLAPLADGSHFVPFAPVAIRSFLTHCYLHPNTRSGLFFLALSFFLTRHLGQLSVFIKVSWNDYNENLQVKNKKNSSKNKPASRSVKAKPSGFRQKSFYFYLILLVKTFLPEALTALPALPCRVSFLFFVFLLEK